MRMCVYFQWDAHEVKLSGEEMKEALERLAIFLTRRALEWHKAAEDFISMRLCQDLQCPKFQVCSVPFSLNRAIARLFQAIVHRLVCNRYSPEYKTKPSSVRFAY